MRKVIHNLYSPATQHCNSCHYNKLARVVSSPLNGNPPSKTDPHPLKPPGEPHLLTTQTCWCSRSTRFNSVGQAGGVNARRGGPFEIKFWGTVTLQDPFGYQRCFCAEFTGSSDIYTETDVKDPWVGPNPDHSALIHHVQSYSGMTTFFIHIASKYQLWNEHKQEMKMQPKM